MKPDRHQHDPQLWPLPERRALAHGLPNNFTGYLQADGYAGYDKLYETNPVTEVACWAHFRRKIFDIHATKAYIADVIAKIAGNWPAAKWDELMPWNWQPDNQVIAEAA